MTRVALDTNILIYAEIEPDSDKGARAVDVIARAGRDGVIPTQALGEFLRFIQRRYPDAWDGAVGQVDHYARTFLTPPTGMDVFEAAAEIAGKHRIQMWDAVICVAAIQAGAKALLTADMQDGADVGGLRLLNPFSPANGLAIDALIGK